MGTTTHLSAGRIALIGLGVTLILGGLAARSLIENTSSLPYRALTAPDGVTGAYLVEEPTEGDPIELEQLEDGTFAVVSVSEGTRTTLFSGGEEAAAFWLESRGAIAEFTGTPAAVDDWIAERQAEEDSDTIPITLMVLGAVGVLGGIAIGWRRPSAT